MFIIIFRSGLMVGPFDNREEATKAADTYSCEYNIKYVMPIEAWSEHAEEEAITV